MNFTLGEIRIMKDPMIALLDEKLPIKQAWKLNKLAKAFEKELQEIEEFRVNLVRKLGVQEEGNEEAEAISVPADNMEAFVTEFNELLNQEVTIDFDPIDIDSLGEDIKVSSKDLMSLEKIFS